MLDKLYKTQKHLLLVYLVCISIMITLKIDRVGVMMLTLSFLSLNYNKYVALFGAIVCTYYFYSYREGFTTTEPTNKKGKPINKIYYKFLDYFDQTPIGKPSLQRKNLAELFSFYGIIDTRFYITDTVSPSTTRDPSPNVSPSTTRVPNNIYEMFTVSPSTTRVPNKLDEMLYDTLGKLFKLRSDPDLDPSKRFSVENVVYKDEYKKKPDSTTNKNNAYKGTSLKNALVGSRLEYNMKLLYLRNLVRSTDLSETTDTSVSFKAPNITDSQTTNISQVDKLVKDAEYKTVGMLNREAETILIDKNDIKHVELLSNLSRQFSSNMIQIIEDMLNLSEEKLQFTTVYDSYIYYIKQIFYIFTEQGRLFYVGLFFMVVSICLFFIETTK